MSQINNLLLCCGLPKIRENNEIKNLKKQWSDSIWIHVEAVWNQK